MRPRIDHVGLVVGDLDRTSAFYVRLLNGRREVLGHHPLVVSGDVRLAFTPAGRGPHVAIAIDLPHRELVARLEAWGAPHELRDGRLYTVDPDGFVLELVSPI